MSSHVDVRLKDNPYSIVIGHGILNQLPLHLKKCGVDAQDAVIVSHASIERLHGKALVSGLKKAGYSIKFLNVPEGEQSKSAGVALKLIEQIAAYDVGRKIVVIAFGGGVIGDLAGFVAAIYKRGVPYVQIPTTLLAQIDSSIGGKTAIDLKVGKNLVGAYYQPKLVLSDTQVLETLSPRQIRNGLAEAIKYGVIADVQLFAYIEANYQKFLNHDPAVLNTIVKRCSEIKADVVSKDEKETKGLRTILNFGHTVGHAVEAAAKYNQYHHGEAVGLGMRIASRISVGMKLLSTKDEARINALISAVGLPEYIQKVSLNSIIDLMCHDKKFIGNRNRFVLAQKIGQVQVKEAIPMPLITTSIKAYSK